MSGRARPTYCRLVAFHRTLDQKLTESEPRAIATHHAPALRRSPGQQPSSKNAQIERDPQAFGRLYKTWFRTTIAFKRCRPYASRSRQRSTYLFGADAPGIRTHSRENRAYRAKNPTATPGCSRLRTRHPKARTHLDARARRQKRKYRTRRVQRLSALTSPAELATSHTRVLSMRLLFIIAPGNRATLSSATTVHAKR